MDYRTTGGAALLDGRRRSGFLRDGGPSVNGQGELDGRAGGAAPRDDRAAVRLDECLADRQSQAAAARPLLSPAVRAVEAFEHVRELCALDPRSLVRHGDYHRAIVYLGAHRDIV